MKSTLLLFVALLGGAQAFSPDFVRIPPSSIVQGTATKTRHIRRSVHRGISYGEESRKYRRTVYKHDDWVRHRADDRFIRNIRSIVSSGVYKNIAKEVASCLLVATLLIVYNGATGEYADFAGVRHGGILAESPLPPLQLPLQLFTLSSSSLGLLLVFRTNTSYSRWDEARKNWGMNINHTRDLVRMASCYYEREGVQEKVIKQDLDRVALCTWSFVRSMKRHLSPEWEDEEPFVKELREKLPAEQAQKIIDAAHRPNRALQDLTYSVRVLPMDPLLKVEMNRAITIFEDTLGGTERLLSSPVPLFYSRLTARFAIIWLLTFPFGMYEAFANTWNHIGLIPSTGVMASALLGIDEIATQLEEPFTILPMQGFCDKVYAGCTEIVSWEPNDNNMFTDQYAYEVEARIQKQESIYDYYEQPLNGNTNGSNAMRVRDNNKPMEVPLNGKSNGFHESEGALDEGISAGTNGFADDTSSEDVYGYNQRRRLRSFFFRSQN